MSIVAPIDRHSTSGCSLGQRMKGVQTKRGDIASNDESGAGVPAYRAARTIPRKRVRASYRDATPIHWRRWKRPDDEVRAGTLRPLLMNRRSASLTRDVPANELAD